MQNRSLHATAAVMAMMSSTPFVVAANINADPRLPALRADEYTIERHLTVAGEQCEKIIAANSNTGKLAWADGTANDMKANRGLRIGHHTRRQDGGRVPSTCYQRVCLLN